MPNSQHHYAYGEGKAQIETVMRFHAVKRWHMIDTTRQQTLAEHSANVAALAFGISATCPEAYFGSPKELLAAALFHDMEEVFVGDIPSHTKPYLQPDLEKLEVRLLPRVWQIHAGSRDAKYLIKLCDLADGIRFIRLHGVDVTARHAREGLEEQLSAMATVITRNKGVGGLNWPQEVYKHVMEWIMFYAYENH